MARKSLLYYLFSKNKAPLYVDDNNHVQEGDPGNYSKPDGQPAHLKFSPQGWKDVLVKYARNTKYFGLFRDMTVPMKFVGDGAKILRTLMWNDGVEAVCYLGVAKLDRTSLPYNYKSWYFSEINFSKYKETKTGVQVEALEGGLSKLLKANENTVYEIPLDDYDAFFVQRTGLVFIITANYLLPERTVPGGTPSGWKSSQYMTVNFINSENAHGSDLAFFSVSWGYTQQPGWDFSNDFNYFLYSGSNRTLHVKGSIKADFHGTNNMQFLIVDNFGNFLWDSGLLSLTDIQEINIDTNIVVIEGSKLFFVSNDLTGSVVDYKETSLVISVEYQFKNSYTKELYPFRVLELLINKMTNGKYQAQSAWLTAMKDISLTSGNGIRGISEATIKTSLTDFFKAFNHFSIGLTVKDDKLIIEPLAYFLDNSIIADIGVVDDAEITIAEDISFNTIKAGYKEKEYSDVNGKYEFNQGQQWSTPVTKIIKELDLVSPYRADPIGTELLRMNYEGLSTTDKQDDNEVFITNIKTSSSSIVTKVDFVAAGNYMTNPDNFPFTAGNIIQISGSTSNNKMLLVVATGVNIVQFDTGWPLIVDEAGANIVITFIKGGIFQLNRPAYTAMTGIPATMVASIYNVEISSKKGMLNNGAFIRSILDLLDADLIKFQSADKNADLSRTLAGITITENENIQIGSLDARLFRPYYINFRTKVPINLLELINANPFGKIKFRYNDWDFYGYLMDGGIKPATQDSQTWKLLSAPENDMKKFEA